WTDFGLAPASAATWRSPSLRTISAGIGPSPGLSLSVARCPACASLSPTGLVFLDRPLHLFLAPGRHFSAVVLAQRLEPVMGHHLAAAAVRGEAKGVHFLRWRPDIRTFDDVGRLALHELLEGQPLVADGRLHWLLVNVHGNEDQAGTILLEQAGILFQ